MSDSQPTQDREMTDELKSVGHFRLLLPTLKKDANGMREGRVLRGIRPSCLSNKAVIFGLEDNRLRAGYVLRFLHLERNTQRKEFWWVPIDEYCGIEIKKDAKIYRSADFK